MNPKNGKFLNRMRKAYGWSRQKEMSDLEVIRMAHKHTFYAMLTTMILLFSNTSMYMGNRQRSALHGNQNTTFDLILLIVLALGLILMFVRFRQAEKCRSELEDMYIENDRNYSESVEEKIAKSVPQPDEGPKWVEPF